MFCERDYVQNNTIPQIMKFHSGIKQNFIAYNLLCYNSVVHTKTEQVFIGMCMKSFILIESFLYASTPKYTIATTPKQFCSTYTSQPAYSWIVSD